MTRIDWQHIPFFATVDSCGLRKLDVCVRPHGFPAGAAIFSEGDDCAGLHVLLEGMVRIYRVNTEGRLHTLNLLQPVATFNEVAAIDGGANPFNATAVTQVEAAVIPHRDLLAIMASEPTLMANTVQALARLNREYIERLEDMTFRTIPARLAKLFLTETNAIDPVASAPSQLTQEEIAAILGTTREVVGRAMRQLMNAGLLRKKGRHVYVADRAGLAALADSGALREETAAER
ncbi:MAG: Crp/Fnr family transcriptional regulator [Chloroflexota bacterium]|nr:Crp/Fnr family transcriptional regulator [Chloroflexota bacterium]